MKRIVYILVFVLYLLIPHSVFSQDTKYITAEFHVDGVCGDCKQRIENAAYLKGVKFCEWNKEKGILKLIYDPKKVTPESIHRSIANAGHDTDKVEADSLAYSKLPKCCAYEDAIEKH